MYKPGTSYDEYLEKEQEKYPELSLNDIEELTERVKDNDELPPVPAKLIVMFLHSSYFDVDKAYNTIVLHYKYRKELPQFFENYDPAEDGMKKVFDTITIAHLTESRTGKETHVVYTNFKNVDAQAFDYVQSNRFFFMFVHRLVMTTGTFDGLILVMNAKGMSWRHIAKTPMNIMKKLLYFVEEAMPIRLKEVHVINAGSIVTMLFNIIKPFMRNGLMDLVQIHSEGSTDVFNNVDIDIIPTEAGGNGVSEYVYSEKTYKRMLDARDWYLSSSN